MKRTAQCGLKHEWQCEAQLIDGAIAHREGKRRPRPFKQWFVVPSRCPTCGHPWTMLQEVKHGQQ